MGLSLRQIVTFLSGHIPPDAHRVFIDGEEKGKCTRASFRTVVVLSGLEFPVDYAYELDGATTTLSSRMRIQGLGAGGREQIKVNGKDVTGDDVVIGFEAPNAYVEFRFKDGETPRSVKFVAPLKDYSPGG
ncbi:MAG: hypothetical protein JST35_00190 [Armatimonadetes bacterium]|nr:hypothetical protein [Armatimonadota bacterium]